MAVAFPTRDQVHAWLQEYDGQRKPTKKLAEYFEAKLAEAGLENVIVRDDHNVVYFLLDDLDSYA